MFDCYMMKSLSLFALYFFLSPAVNLSKPTVYNTEANQEVLINQYNLKVAPEIEPYQRCVQSGLVSELQVYLLFCRSNRGFLESRCSSERKLASRIKQDPISGRLTVEHDVLGDKLPATKQVLSEEEEAIRQWTDFPSVNFVALEQAITPAISTADSLEAVQINVLQKCHRPSMLIERLGSFISFGLFDTDYQTSGWTEFKLKAK